MSGQLKVKERTGLTKTEEEALLLFCLSDDYPREHVVERTGTKFILRGEREARLLWRRIKRQNPQFDRAYGTLIAGTKITGYLFDFEADFWERKWLDRM